jgi:hypothetical protein
MITSTSFSRFGFTLAALCAFTTGVFAQAPAPKLALPDPSAKATVQQRVGITDIEVVYSRPGVKGRKKIFGGLEPWGEIWRAGANSTTKVTFSTPVKVGGQELAAGSYGLFAKIGESEWTVIFTKAPNQWGAYAYDPKDDAARVTVKPVKLAEAVETFTIDVNDIRDTSATLNLIWEKTRVPVKIEIDTVGMLVPQLEALMASDAPKKPYVPAAMFYLDNKLDLNKALGWMNAAIAEEPNAFYYVYRKAKVQAAMGDKAGALASANASIEGAKKANGAVKDEYIRLNEALIASLK